MERTEGYGCLMLMVPAALYGELVERAEAHERSLAMEVLLMLERDVAPDKILEVERGYGGIGMAKGGGE